MSIKLSILDQTPVRLNSNAVESLQETITLARLADDFGFTRYWVSEHHNIISLACAAPEVLLARLGAETRRIRIGSGGIMLPNHSALKVAENFRLLEALYPGRIDLGLGRAPGGDRLTASLLNPGNNFEPQDYIQQISSLQSFLLGDGSPGTVFEKVSAIPRIDTCPHLWILTSSGESAFLAAYLGLSLSFAHFINPVGGPEAVMQYRKKFRPSKMLQSPGASVGVFVFCSESEEKISVNQAMMDYRLLSISRGQSDTAPDYNAVRTYKYSSEERALIQFNRQRMIFGTPKVVKEKVTKLASAYGVEEVVVATFAEDFEDRLRSYQLLAELFLSPGVAGTDYNRRREIDTPEAQTR